MAKTLKQKIGLWGEKIAAEFLFQNGHIILEKNWRSGKAEIDLITKEGNTLVFVEVKTRKNASFGHPEDFVGNQKSKLVKTASVEYQYLNQYEGFIRFDIVAITGNEKEYELIHLKDSF